MKPAFTMHFIIPTHHNMAIISGIIALHLLVLIVLPLWLLPLSMWWAAIIPLTIWVHNTHWGLIHEAVHKLLHPNARMNEGFGRMLCILMGPSFHILRFGHLMHHQYNREWESEFYDEAQAHWKERLHYYYKLIGGLYITELAVSLAAAMLPSSVVRRGVHGKLARTFKPAGPAAENVFFRRGKLRAVRIDMALSVLLYGSALYLYGAYWMVLLAFIAARALSVSFFDNIYHYATPADNSKAAKELAMPRIVSAMLLHGNYHETHHQQPNIPWYYLPRHQRVPFRQGFMNGALQQLGGPISLTTGEAYAA